MRQGGAMQRIHAPFDEPTLAQIDQEVKKSGVSRAQWLSSAIGAYLHLLELTKGADPCEMILEQAQLRTTNDSMWKENQQLKRAEERSREDVAQIERKLHTIEDQIVSTNIELEKARSDMILMEHDKAHYQDTITQKDQQITFLQAHIAQLTQSISQLSLRPGDEEIKKKGWWQFWRRG
jgi:chromosome segregation ATPase